ncbi:MAG: T9SS type A sorting domain-containing protein [Chlorobi bacterium]|nr:T9SS type A sorting domain-containing protein [Chlorobiota bacterium]
MKKFLSLLISMTFSLVLLAQMPQLPEILQEKMDEEHLDLTVNYDETEQVKTEEEYYAFISRTLGTDTLLGYHWSEDAQDWALRARIIKNYNDDELVTEKYFQFLNDDGDWQDGLLFNYSYTSFGSLSELLIQHWNNDSSLWVNYFKKINTYNDAENLAEIETQWWSHWHQDWVPHQMKVFTWTGGLLTADTVKYLPFNSDAWLSHHYSSFDYNDLGMKTSKTVYRWKWWSGEWKNERNYLYSYDDSGDNIITVISQYWAGDAGWKDAHRYNYTYTDFDEVSNYLAEYWNEWGSEWKADINIAYTYNDEELLSNYVWQQMPWWGDQWVNVQQASYTYDVDGNMTETIIQKWHHWTEEWVNWRKWEMILDYNQVMGIADNTGNGIEAIFENPYRPGQAISFKGLRQDNYQLQLFDLSGRLIESTTINGNAAGSFGNVGGNTLYFMTLSGSKGLVYSTKILINN